MSSPVLTRAALRDKFAGHAPKRLPTTEQTIFSAVAAVLQLGTDAAEVMLIRRAEHPNDHWSGHMAFPGGRKHPGDSSTLETATRETHEEVAVDLTRDAELVGRLDDIQAVSKGIVRDMLIVPYVFVLTSPVSPVLDPREVAELTWAPVEPMMRGDLNTIRPYVHEGRHLQLPGYQVGANIVWGLTHRMLELLFDVIRR